MFNVDFIIYKINSNINYIFKMWHELFIKPTPPDPDHGYTIISKNNVKYLSYEEIWEDSE
jgi:hypothetical protein